jgi:uncharacterized protein YggE
LEVLKMRLFFAILFCVLSAPALVAGTLIVDGEGQVSRVPDHAVIEVSLREQGRDASAILLNLRNRVDSVINALKENGIDAKHIATQRLDVRLDYDYDQKKRAPRDYIASTSLRIRQDDLSKLATVLDGASLLDVDGLSDLRFRYHLTQADYDLALTRAVKAALHEAELIAVASGQSLSSIQEIRQNGSGGGVVMARMEMSAAPRVKGYIAPENVTISKTITMEIESVDGTAQ